MQPWPEELDELLRQVHSCHCACTSKHQMPPSAACAQLRRDIWCLYEGLQAARREVLNG